MLALLAGPVRAQVFSEPVPEQVAVADLLSAAPYDATVVLDGASASLADLAPLAYPLGLPAEQIDPWGWRFADSRGARRMHTGVDFAAPTGTAVLAALAGRVVLAEAVSGYGLTVVLDHGRGVQTLYAHLQQIDVARGATLAQGQLLGLVGMTGRATGPHLHFELRSRGAASLAHDPTPHLPPLMPPPALTASRP